MIKRRLLNLAAATSLLLAIAMAILWERSYWRQEGVWREDGKTGQSFVSFGGRLEYGMRSGFERGPLSWKYDATKFPHRVRYQPMEPPTTWYGRLGFSYTNGFWTRASGGLVHDVGITVPYWSLVMPLFILSALCAIAWWKGRTRATRGFEVGGSAGGSNGVNE